MQHPPNINLSRADLKDPKVGEKAPDWLLKYAGRRPIVLWTACPTCTTTGVEDVALSVKQDGLVHVVSLDDKTYLMTALRGANATLLEVSTEMAEDMGPAFSPRVYVLDWRGRWLYIQGVAESFQEALPHAKRTGHNHTR